MNAAECLFREQRAAILQDASKAAAQLAASAALEARRATIDEARAAADRAASALREKTSTELEALEATCAAKREALEARVTSKYNADADRCIEAARSAERKVDDLASDVNKKLGLRHEEVKKSVEQGIDGVRQALMKTVKTLDGQQKTTIENINSALAARD